MSNSTNAYLKGKVEIETLLQFIRQKFDCNAMFSNRKRDYVTTSFAEKIKNGKDFNALGNDNFYIDSAFITFTYNEEKIILYYMYSNYVAYNNLNDYKQCGLIGMAKSEKTFLSSGCSEPRQKIMTEIVKNFGGWFDFDDLDDIPYQEIKKGTEMPEKVRHVTMQEIYEKFGEVVIIDDFK